ncbi:MAG: CPBP family intramembrane metalloprotease [Gammaproteobacteria bacterium]|nr:CPBP family intramembrane metalloprotease [Gammaproteobacteria bacterium]NVK88651.1 CPBP family intramembrane metalloprotease [Gammaproteobacteria bacterium]
MNTTTLFDGRITFVRIFTAFLVAKFSQSFLLEAYPVDILYPISMVLVFAVFWGLLRLFCHPAELSLKLFINTEPRPFSIITLIGLVIVVVITKYGSAVMLFSYYEWFGETNLETLQQLQALAEQSIWQRLDVSALTGMFGAPIVEEFFYRAVLVSYLAARFRPSIAIIIAASIFAMFHGFSGFFLALGGGILLSSVYLYYRNIWLCIGLHCIANLMTFLAPGIVADALVFNWSSSSEIALSLLNIASGILVVIMIILLPYGLRRSPVPNAELAAQIKNQLSKAQD